MKRRNLNVGIVTFLLLCAMVVQAEPSRTRHLGRGVSNVLTGIVEIPSNMYQVSQEHGGWAGVTWGFFRGVYRFAVREGVGLYEIVTFPCAYEPIIEPEFPFQQGQSVTWRVNPDYKEKY